MHTNFDVHSAADVAVSDKTRKSWMSGRNKVPEVMLLTVVSVVSVVVCFDFVVLSRVL